jgi:hypothetical protein
MLGRTEEESLFWGMPTEVIFTVVQQTFGKD